MPIQKKTHRERSRKHCADFATEVEESQFFPVHTLSFTVGVQAMEWRKSVFMLALAAFAVSAIGPQAGLNTAAADEVTVIGDVEHFQSFTISPGSELTVREAVLKAGMLSDSASVTRVRYAQDHALSMHFVAATSADTGEIVENGDVLMVQAMSPLRGTVIKNAALRTDDGVKTLSLEQEGIVFGDVLTQTDSLPLGDRRLRVLCRFRGQASITKAELYHPIEHGDVISISKGSQTTHKGFGSMVPSVSEWSGGTKTEFQDSPGENLLSSNDVSLSDNEPVASPSHSFVSAESPIFIPVQEGTPKLPDEIVESIATGDLNSHQSSTGLTTMLIGRSENVPDSDTARNKASYISEATTSAPVAPQEMQIGAVTNSQTSAFNPWNLVFIGGLLVAGTLILAGTLRPEPDDNTEFSNAAALATDLIASTSWQQKSASSSPPQKTTSPTYNQFATRESHRPSAPTPPQEVVDSTIETAIPAGSAEQQAETSVAAHEWFSNDWRGRVVTTSRGSHQESPVEAAQEVVPSVEKPTAASKRPTMRSVISASSVMADAEAAKAAEAARMEAKSISDLDDLLKNRLPIDLCETQLPLRIALFGKPAGPRRLRIDAAHSAIPEPHINRTIEKRREQPLATTSSAAPVARDFPMQPDATPTRSLDRALHFLQERTES